MRTANSLWPGGGGEAVVSPSHAQQQRSPLLPPSPFPDSPAVRFAGLALRPLGSVSVPTGPPSRSGSRCKAVPVSPLFLSLLHNSLPLSPATVPQQPKIPQALFSP